MTGMTEKTTVSRLGGLIGTSFLIGIALHSLWPYQSVGSLILTALTVIAMLLLSFGWKHPSGKIVGCVFLALVVGVWRFDVTGRSLPRHLIPFSPQGLAYVSGNATTADQTDPRYWLGRARNFFTQRSNQIFPGDEGALLTGILYGERGLTKPTKDNFRRAGLLHIIAVSGSNVTIVVVLVMPMLLWLGLRRKTAFGALTFALIAFVLFVNPYASVVRAALMGWLIELAPLLGRIPRPSRLLLIAAVFFVAWQPWALFYDASFALSFLAMWGLLVWTPWFYERLQKIVPWKGVRQIVSATFGATLMTTPYTAWAFGQVTVFGVITSLLVLPIIPWIMTVGIFALIFPVAIFTLPARGFLDWILWVAKMPNVVPVGVWSNLSTPFSFMIGLYACLFAIWRLVQRKNRLIHEQT